MVGTCESEVGGESLIVIFWDMLYISFDLLSVVHLPDNYIVNFLCALNSGGMVQSQLS
jgi:hypothetical protein